MSAAFLLSSTSYMATYWKQTWGNVNYIRFSGDQCEQETEDILLKIPKTFYL